MHQTEQVCDDVSLQLNSFDSACLTQCCYRLLLSHGILEGREMGLWLRERATERKFVLYTVTVIHFFCLFHINCMYNFWHRLLKMDIPSVTEQSLYSICANVSMEGVYALVLMRGITGVVCFGLCLVSLILEIANICLSKAGSTILQRFFVYVILANLLRAAFLSMDIISHRSGLNVNEKFCEAIGFISQYFASFQLLTITSMMFLLFHNLFLLNQKYKYFCTNCSLTSTRYVDIIVISILFLLPSLYVWVPFIIEGGVYGDAGPWCWLKEYDSDCNEIKAVFIFESVFWNVPFGAVLIFCFVCVVVYILFFLYTGCWRRMAYKMLTSILVESCILFFFFAFYTSLCVIELAALIYVHYRRTSGGYPWLVLYAITLPIGEISLSLTSFAYLFRILYKFCKERRDREKIGRSIPNMSEHERIYPSTRVSVKSFTSQQDRPAFVSPSSEWTSILPDNVSRYGSL